MSELPIVLEDYLSYMETIKGTSANTVKEYFFDLRMFLRFLKKRYKIVSDDVEFDDIDIGDIDISILRKVNLQDLHAYISYVDKSRNNKSLARSRKVASLRSFFDYLHAKVNLLDTNPAFQLESPKTSSRHPVHLTLDQCNELLDAALANKNKEYSKRDYAIITIFLNCGLRLSELSSIDIDKIKDDNTLSVIGKGNKERIIFLNDSCVDAINEYLKVRPKKVNDEKALFISKQKNRMSNRAIQHMVDRYFVKIGLDTDVYSTHKLRHTAATLMYQYGNVDILALQEILGHESVATTQIYTHINNDRLRDAVKSNPLADRNSEKK